MARKPRKTYTEAQRQQVLNVATSEGLTALQVQKRFGVTPVTYYSWRKKKGLKGPRGRKPGIAAVAASGGDLSAQVRAGVQARVRAILPGVVRDEVARYLDTLFGAEGKSARRGARRKK